MKRTLLIAFSILGLAAPLLAAETRGMKVVARDAVTGQPGEVGIYRKTFAVIIGIDRYQNLPPDRQLQNAVRDAKGVEEVLRKNYRFDKIITIFDEKATKDRILKLLTSELPREMGRDDALLIFWAGHGNQELTEYGELGYLIPYDGSADEIYRNVTMAEIRDTISKKIPAKHVLYVMDACYSGLLTTRSVDSKSRRDLSYLKEITKESVRQVLTAGGKGEEALDGGPKGHSVFTGRLIELLENSGDFITANELQASIRERVYSDAKARNHTQTPGFGTLYGLGDFVFIPRQQDRLGDLTAGSAVRQKELEQLRKMEQEAAAAKQKEQTEIAKREQELATLDKQIAEMKGRLGAGAARSSDSLDAMVAMVEQKEQQEKHLEELRQQREAEERKRQQEIERLRQEAITKRTDQLKADLAKYQKVASSKYGQDMKGTAWDALVATYPEAKTVNRFDVDALLAVQGLVNDNGSIISHVEKERRQALQVDVRERMDKHPLVLMETSMGDVKLELFEKEAPISVKNFLAYVNSGFYSGTIFHRVIKRFMIQGGGFSTDFSQKSTNTPIKNEGDNGLKNQRGTIATARTSAPDSATCQFFINVANNESLDRPKPDGHGYAVFGKVIEGMDVVDRIEAVKTGSYRGFQDVPEVQVVIKSIRVLK